MGDDAVAAELATTSPPPPSRWVRAREWVLEQPVRRIALGVAGLALVASAPFGGWAEADSDGPQAAAVGAVLDAAPLQVTVTRARFGASITDTLTTTGTFLIVFATVRNTSDRTIDRAVLADVVRLEGVSGLHREAMFVHEIVPAERAAPAVYYAEDATKMSTLGPGMDYALAFFFERASAADLPQELTVVTQRHTWRLDSFDGTMQWRDPEPAARVTLPLLPYQPPAPSPT